MKKISIHDYEHGRTLFLDIPKETQKALKSLELEDQATLIMSALGLSSGSCEWMDATKAELVECSADELVADFQSNIESEIADME